MWPSISWEGVNVTVHVHVCTCTGVYACTTCTYAHVCSACTCTCTYMYMHLTCFIFSSPLSLCCSLCLCIHRDLAWHDLAFYNADLYEGLRRMLLDAQEGKKTKEEFMSTYCCYFEVLSKIHVHVYVRTCLLTLNRIQVLSSL